MLLSDATIFYFFLHFIIEQVSVTYLFLWKVNTLTTILFSPLHDNPHKNHINNENTDGDRIPAHYYYYQTMA